LTTKTETKKSGTAKQPSTGVLEIILETLEDAKAEETISINLTEKSPVADHMIVTSGRSQRHVSAIADQVVKQMRKEGMGKPRIEGQPNCDWVLIDNGDIILHIFRPEVRDFYKLEKLWSENTPTDQMAI